MTVVERPRGLLVAGVFDDSPGQAGGDPAGRPDHRGQRQVDRGQVERRVHRPDQGQAGHLRAPHGPQRPGKHARQLRVRRERIRVPAVDGGAAARGGPQGRACVKLASFTSRRARRAGRARCERLERRGAEGFVLDLRANGGGLLDEAVLVSSAFVPDGTIVTTDGRASGRSGSSRRPATSATRKPVVVLVDRGTASASEIVDRRAARAPRRAGRRPADLRQGRLRPDLRPLQRRRARPGGRQLLHADGPQPEREVASGRTCARVDDLDTRRDEALERALDTLCGRIERSAERTR